MFCGLKYTYSNSCQVIASLTCHVKIYKLFTVKTLVMEFANNGKTYKMEKSWKTSLPCLTLFHPTRICRRWRRISSKLEEIGSDPSERPGGHGTGRMRRKLEVSRPTFQRILISAREKIADSLITGKAILIEGAFHLNICPVKCSKLRKQMDGELRKS